MKKNEKVAMTVTVSPKTIKILEDVKASGKSKGSFVDDAVHNFYKEKTK